MQLTTPNADWFEPETDRATLAILDYRADVRRIGNSFRWLVIRLRDDETDVVASGTCADDDADARDAVEAAIRADFQDRK